MNRLMLLACCLIAFPLYAYQAGDSNFAPNNSKIYYQNKQAPTVLIDEAHHNFHTMDGRYQAFSKILRSDGYLLKKNKKKFTESSLSKANILVVSNALNEKNVKNWNLPNYSAFTRQEIEAVYTWVNNGGSLFLIADHMPFPKASEDLAAIFGF